MFSFFAYAENPLEHALLLQLAFPDAVRSEGGTRETTRGHFRFWMKHREESQAG